MRRIARLAGVGPGDHVVEIGAGLGSLTLALRRDGADGHRRRDRPPPGAGAARVGRAAPARTVVEADALALDWTRCSGGTAAGCWSPTCPTTSPRRSVLDLLDGVPAIERMLVMVQREVGERLAAGPGDDGLRHPRR